jgi:predicted transcriptional regulator
VDFPINYGDQILICNVPDTEDDVSYGKILFCNVPDTEDGVSYGNEDGEDMATIEELPSGFGMNLNQHGLSFSFLL